MGKRKERRLAAKIGAGRRVKLDLFAEPSGDLGGSSAKDEVGKDMDAKPDAELSNSPSSSGQNDDNPLSLLGQYSDDELEQESNETANVDKDSAVAADDQTKVSVSIPPEEGEIVEDENPSAQNADSCDPETKSGLVGASQIVEAVTDDKHHVVSTEIVDHARDASDAQTAGDVSSCWKMVLHEESNQYYYWNTVTGETSWVVPDALSQASGTGGGHGGHEALGTGMKEIATGDVNASGTAFGVKAEGFPTIDSTGYVSGLSDVVAACEHGPQANQSMEQSKGDAIQYLGRSSDVGAVPCETATLVNYAQYSQVNVGGVSASALGYEVHGYAISGDQGVVDPLHLISHGEALLDRLKSLQWCGFDSEEHGWISKYISEVEIRLSDIKTLLPYGPSLAPFWLHSERQLNQVENGINTEIEMQKNKISGMHLTSAEGDEDKEDREGESKVKADTTKLSPEKSSAAVRDDDASVVQKASHDEAANVEISNLKPVSVDSHATHLHGAEDGGQEIAGTVQRKESPRSGFQSGEDDDMDVDMEVEDPNPEREVALDRGGQTGTPSEQLAEPNVSKADEPLGTGGEFIPPPPDEEWIPPPPPDNEDIPPPPPDEPPEPSCPLPPPAEPEPVQSVYSDPYNLPYAESGINYYGNTATGTSAGSFYENVDGSQMSIVNPPVYYAAVSNVQPAAVPAASNSAVYYGLQSGGMPVVPVDPTIGSFGFQAASGFVSGNPLSNQVTTVDASTGASLLSNQHVELHLPGAKTDAGSTEASSSVVSVPTTVSVKEYVSVPSFSAAAASVSATSTSTVSETSTTVSKAQPKATRVKKPKVNVASSLRSNKKVSSLVDKWKAAKEELEEEEEKVPESRLEILEKKRQREIEEWRAQQIASGEAKENANFQPLGGDWRERVKRKRAKKEAVAELLSVTVSNESKQPDLDQLSKDLPSGWQAFWDESTKQVYYGNSITSETTWTKPSS